MMPFLKYMRDYDNFMELLLRNPDRYSPIVDFVDKVTQQLSELTWLECESLAVEMAEQDHSPFCAGIHIGVVDALKHSTDESVTTAKFDALRRFALKLNTDASAIGITDIEAVKLAGWSEQTVEDVVGLVAMMKLYTTLDLGLGFTATSDETFAAMGRATVEHRGYLATFHAFLNAG